MKKAMNVSAGSIIAIILGAAVVLISISFISQSLMNTADVAEKTACKTSVVQNSLGSRPLAVGAGVDVELKCPTDYITVEKGKMKKK